MMSSGKNAEESTILVSDTQNDYLYMYYMVFSANILSKKGKRSPGSAEIKSRSPSQTPRGKGNRQNQTSAN